MNRHLYRSSLCFIATGLLAAACAQLPVDATCTHCVPTRTVQATDFVMGGYVDHGYGRVDGPQREVRFTKPFKFAVHEVTVGDFRRFVTATGHMSERLCNVYTETTTWHINPARNWDDPGFEQDEDHPVVCVSWDDTQAYIRWLNQETGRNYRLPSEAEWEFVTLSGGIGRGSDGTLTHAEGNQGRTECCGGATADADQWLYTAPVGSFKADRHGLQDIRGNVWEWQADCYVDNYLDAPIDGAARIECEDDAYRAIRGGSYGDSGIHQLPRFRLPGRRTQGYFTVGFRVAEDAS